MKWLEKLFKPIYSGSTNKPNRPLKISQGLLKKLNKEKIHSITISVEEINKGFVKFNLKYNDAKNNELFYIDCPRISEGEMITVFDLLSIEIRIRQE